MSRLYPSTGKHALSLDVAYSVSVAHIAMNLRLPLSIPGSFHCTKFLILQRNFLFFNPLASSSTLVQSSTELICFSHPDTLKQVRPLLYPGTGCLFCFDVSGRFMHCNPFTNKLRPLLKLYLWGLIFTSELFHLNVSIKYFSITKGVMTLCFLAFYTFAPFCWSHSILPFSRSGVPALRKLTVCERALKSLLSVSNFQVYSVFFCEHIVIMNLQIRCKMSEKILLNTLYNWACDKDKIILPESWISDYSLFPWKTDITLAEIFELSNKVDNSDEAELYEELLFNQQSRCQSKS